MRDLDVSDYLRELEGPNREDAWHSLVECGPAALPGLFAAFRNATRTSTRVALVELAWQIRSSLALPFLAEALADEEPGVWRQALDGLVTLGGEPARQILRNAMIAADAEKASWIEEALQQCPNRPREATGGRES